MTAPRGREGPSRAMQGATVYRYFTFRLYPSGCQARRMEATVEVCRRFFDLLVEERVTARRAGVPAGLTEQLRRVAQWRREDSSAAQVHSHVLQAVCRDVNASCRAWARKRGNKGEGPRRRREGEVRGFGYKQLGNGFGIDGRRLRLHGVGRVPVRWHRPLEGEIKTLRVYREAGRWYAGFCCAVEASPLPPTGNEVGVDLGTDWLLTTSGGRRVTNPRFALKAQERLAALRGRLARAAHGSAAHREAMLRLGRAQVRVAAQRRDHLAKAVARLLGAYDRVAVEDLDVGRMSGRRAAVSDAGWGLFRRLLEKKAEATGRVVTFVDPAWSSQTCCACGGRNRRHLPVSERVFVCEGCGHAADRDVNAARVILARARELWGPREETAGPQPGRATEAEAEAAAPTG